MSINVIRCQCAGSSDSPMKRYFDLIQYFDLIFFKSCEFLAARDFGISF